MSGAGRTRAVIGLFVEGSRITDPHRDWFNKLWQMLAGHCGHPIELKVFGIDKGRIVALRPPDLPDRGGATALIRQRGFASSAEALDVYIARMVERESLDRVVIAFDAHPPNQALTGEERSRRCPMRSEVAFLLEALSRSRLLPAPLREAARELHARYRSDERLSPRDGPLGPLEIIFMDPMFEALFVADERTVLEALGFDVRKKGRPKDWPKFKTRERDLDKFVLDKAVRCKEKASGRYLAAKAWWGYLIVKQATDSADAALWKHEIATRLCRTMAM